MIKEVAALNKRGIKLFQHGSYEAAIMCFTNAMNHARKNCVQDFAVDVQRAQEKARQMASPLYSEVTACEEADHFLLESMLESGQAEDNIFQLYSRPFLLQDAIVIPPSIISVTLCFNIGLCYHHLGLQRNVSADSKMALRFYERGITILRQNADEGYSSNGMYWLALALLNNAGNILWNFWRTKEALHYRQHINKLVERSQIFSLPSHVIYFFVSGVVDILQIERNAAPAA